MNRFITFVLLSFFYTLGAANAGVSFQERCNAAGVLLCNGFSSSGEVTSYAFPGTGPNSTTPSWDSAMGAEQPGSLRFEYRGNSDANAAGDWRRNFGQEFGENTTVYVQYRLRYTPEMLTGAITQAGSVGMKQHIIYGNASSCSKVEHTSVHIFWHPLIPQLYSQCGDDNYRLYHSPYGNADYWLPMES